MPSPYLNLRENQLCLTGRMPALHWPRFRPTAAETLTFTWWCCAICCYAVVAALGIDALRIVPIVLYVPLLLDLLRWWNRFNTGRWFVPELRFLIAPFTFVWLIGVGIPVLAYFMHPTAWWGVVIGLIGWRMIRMGQRVRTHYVDYCLEHERLTEATRAKWKQRRLNDWQDVPGQPNSEQTEASVGMKQRFDKAVEWMRSEGRSEVLYGFVTLLAAIGSVMLVNALGYVCLREQTSILLVACALTSMGVITSLMQCEAGASLKELWEATWHAIQVFCHSPPTVPLGSRAPWSARSRYGDAENRRAYLVWNVLLVLKQAYAAGL
jgi:hypothetical protein